MSNGQESEATTTTMNPDEPFDFDDVVPADVLEVELAPPISPTFNPQDNPYDHLTDDIEGLFEEASNAYDIDRIRWYRAVSNYYRAGAADQVVYNRQGTLGPEPVTVADIYYTYTTMPAEQKGEVRDLLFAGGFYGAGKSEKYKDAPGQDLYALATAVSYYSMTGENPFEALKTAVPMPGTSGPVIRRATEAQINALADSAAGNLLGRNATVEEKQLAMSVIRSLETSSSMSPLQADVEAAFAESVPQEVAARGSEKALRAFESIVGR